MPHIWRLTRHNLACTALTTVAILAWVSAPIGYMQSDVCGRVILTVATVGTLLSSVVWLAGQVQRLITEVRGQDETLRRLIDDEIPRAVEQSGWFAIGAYLHDVQEIQESQMKPNNVIRMQGR